MIKMTVINVATVDGRRMVRSLVLINVVGKFLL